MNPEQQKRLEQSNIDGRGQSWMHWAANRLNSLFETYGVKDKNGRAPASDIRPETIRDGERKANA